MKISGVVVLYNPDENVLDNIKTYIDLLDVLYVVDNSPIPNDNSKKFKDKKIKYISNNGNKGIAFALNVGAKEALKNGSEWLLTMDQDSSFRKNGVKNMCIFLQKIRNDKYLETIVGTTYKKIGIVSPLHITVRNINYNLEGIDKPLEVMTSGNLINLKAYKKIGGFKDWLFIDCVDFDYCLNLRNNNYEIVQLNYVKLDHELGDTVEKKILNKIVYADNHSVFRRYYITRNRHYLYDMYNKDFPDYCKLELGRTRKELIKIWLFEKEKIAKTKAIYKGYMDYKKGNKGEINEKNCKR